MFRRILTLVTASAVVAAGLVASQAAIADNQSLSSAQAVTAGDWNPGNIISDDLFYDGSAMSSSEVQDFLRSKNGSSAPTALVNYVQATPSMPATSYCSAYEGAPGGETAANIIAKVGAACNLSQKAMLVLLEKEQSLVSMQSPSEGRLAAATGFGCPDTAPCDSSYGGFFYQVYNAARMFQYYKANPYEFNHLPFATNNVLYNPNFGCGSSPVYIENYATAGLYNYTPYQPNGAALSNMYGEGDGCSAYGNRNFWRMYNDWFGSTQGSNQASLIIAEGTSDVYYVSSGTRHYVPKALEATFTAAFGKAATVTAQYMSWIPWGSWATNVLAGPDGPVFVADGTAWSMYGWDQASAFGTAQSAAVPVTASQLARFKSGGRLEWFVQLPSGEVYLGQDGTKRAISDLKPLAAMGFYTGTTSLPADALDALPLGIPSLTSGSVVELAGGGKTVALALGGGAYTLSDDVAALPSFGRTGVFSEEAFSQLKIAGAIDGPFVSDGTRDYLLTEDGLLQVTRAAYGAQQFTQVDETLLRKLPSAGVASGAHFVREEGSSTISLVVGGERVEFSDEAAATAEAKRRGIDATVHVTLKGALSGIKTGNGITDGALLQPQGSSKLYLLDGAHLQEVSGTDVSQELGFGSKATTITPESFAKIPQRETVLSSTFVTCQGATYLVAGGQRYALGSQAMRDAYGVVPQSVSRELCNAIPVASGPASEFLKTSDGTVWLVVGGEKRSIGWPSLIDDLGGKDRAILAVSDFVAGQIPSGAGVYGKIDGYVQPPLTDGATPTPTPTATTTPEPTATVTVTPAPTETATPTPTATVTPAPTETVTPAPTATATPGPTATGEPAVPLADGEVITNASRTGVWIVSGDSLLQFGSTRIADQIGIHVADAKIVPKANFDAFRGRAQLLYSSAVECDGVKYIGVDGALVPFDSPATAAEFGLKHAVLPASVCASLTIAQDRVFTTRVVDAAGDEYTVRGGVLHPVDGATAAVTEAPATVSAERAAAALEATGSTVTATPEPTATTTPVATLTVQPTPTPTATTEPTASPTATTTPAPGAPLTISNELVSVMGKAGAR